MWLWWRNKSIQQEKESPEYIHEIHWLHLAYEIFTLIAFILRFHSFSTFHSSHSISLLHKSIIGNSNVSSICAFRPHQQKESSGYLQYSTAECRNRINSHPIIIFIFSVMLANAHMWKLPSCIKSQRHHGETHTHTQAKRYLFNTSNDQKDLSISCVFALFTAATQIEKVMKLTNIKSCLDSNVPIRNTKYIPYKLLKVKRFHIFGCICVADFKTSEFPQFFFPLESTQLDGASKIVQRKRENVSLFVSLCESEWVCIMCMIQGKRYSIPSPG